MARAIVTREAVFAIADALTAEGVDPTTIGVQERIGGGSYSTVKKFLDAWKEQRAPAPALPVPDSVAAQSAELVRGVWAAALAVADEQTHHVRAQMQRDADLLRTRLAEAEQIIARLETAVNERDERLDTTQQQLQAAQADLATARTELQVQAAHLAEAQRHQQQTQAELAQARQAQVAQARLEGELAALQRQLADQRSLIERISAAKPADPPPPDTR